MCDAFEREKGAREKSAQICLWFDFPDFLLLRLTVHWLIEPPEAELLTYQIESFNVPWQKRTQNHKISCACAVLVCVRARPMSMFSRWWMKFLDHYIDVGWFEDVIYFQWNRFVTHNCSTGVPVRVKCLEIHFHAELLRRSRKELLPSSAIESIYALERETKSVLVAREKERERVGRLRGKSFLLLLLQCEKKLRKAFAVQPCDELEQ